MLEKSLSSASSKSKLLGVSSSNPDYLSLSHLKYLWPQGGEYKIELKTGALCCIVASRPLVKTKSSPPHSYGRDIPSLSQDDDTLQWRTNFSFSPAGYTRDDLEQEVSSSSRQRTSLEFRFQQSPRWVSTSSETCVVNSVSSPNSSNLQCLNEEKGFGGDSTAMSTSFRSLLSLSESFAPLETSSKLTQCSYPRVFCNPVSDCENNEPDHTQEDSSTNADSRSMMSTRNHQGLPVEEATDVERSNETEAINPRLETESKTDQRCGICKKLLSQKSPWCSSKILRSGDMPATGVFPCHHVYHVECLDKVTPTAQTRDPLCPVCSNTIKTMEQPPLIAPETLQMALRSLRRSHTDVRSETVSRPCNDNNQRTHIRRRRRRRSHKWEKLVSCLHISFSSSS